jgi:hypothetical protein
VKTINITLLSKFLFTDLSVLVLLEITAFNETIIDMYVLGREFTVRGNG